MAHEHRARHKAHLDKHVKDVGGTYHCVGVWYVLSGGRRALVPFALWVSLTAALVIAAGCGSFRGLMNTWYVILPYVGTVGMLLGLGLQAWRMVSGGGRLKSFDYERMQDRVVPFAGTLVLLAVLTAGLGGVFLALSGEKPQASDALFFAPILLSAAASRMAISAYRAQKWLHESGRLPSKEDL